MLKSEYFAEVRGFRCNKQQAAVCACGLYQISAGGPSMAMTRHRLHSSNYAVSEQVVKPREPREEPLSARRPPRPQPVSGQFISK